MGHTLKSNYNYNHNHNNNNNNSTDSMCNMNNFPAAADSVVVVVLSTFAFGVSNIS